MGRNFELKKSNTLAIFHAMQKVRTISRRELEEMTGLSWGSVSAICSALLRKGIITGEKEFASTGRPPERLTVCTTKKLSLGIDINSVGLSFNVVNLAGVSVYSDFLTVESSYKDDVLALLEEKTRGILDRYADILSINLSMQGALDRAAGISLRSNFFKNWENVPLVEFFEKKFGIRTFLYHDPECLLTYHLNNDPRLKNKDSGIVIRVDDGIGMAQLTNGNLYESGGTPACELGHTIVIPDGLACPCGKKGCLEAYSSLRGMHYLFSNTANGSSEEFIRAALSHDEKAEGIARQACVYLGLAIANLFTLYNPEFIIVDGKAIVKLPFFFEEIRKHVGSFYGGSFNLLRAEYKMDAAAIGAAMLTIDKQLENILFDDADFPDARIYETGAFHGAEA